MKLHEEADYELVIELRHPQQVALVVLVAHLTIRYDVRSRLTLGVAVHDVVHRGEHREFVDLNLLNTSRSDPSSLVQLHLEPARPPVARAAQIRHASAQ